MTKLLDLICLAIVLLLTFCVYSYVHASEYSDEQIVDAIYHAEGGTKAKKPFGILSVPCDGYDDCRKVCLNTVRNNRVRYKKWGYKKHPTYLAFLASRYAPTEGATNDPNNLNKNWLKNVEAILEGNKR